MAVQGGDGRLAHVWQWWYYCMYKYMCMVVVVYNGQRSDLINVHVIKTLYSMCAYIYCHACVCTCEKEYVGECACLCTCIQDRISVYTYVVVCPDMCMCAHIHMASLPNTTVQQ